MAGFKNATKGYLPGIQVQSADIAADAVVAADIAANAVTATEISAGTVTNANLRGAIAHTKLLSGAASGYFTAKYLQANCVTHSQVAANAVGQGMISAAAVRAGDISAATIKAAAISAATITNAKLSSPESFFELRARIAKRAANQAAASVAFLGRLPAAAVLVNAYAAASVINNVALATPGVCVWIGNGTSRLLTGSGIVVPSTAFRPASGAVSTLCATQTAGKNIYASAKTSTTTSGLGVDVVSVWKVAHTT